MTESTLGRAFHCLQQGEFATALPIALQAVDEEPLNWNAWYVAGQSYRFLEQFDSAVRYHSRAVTLNSDRPEVWTALGVALQLSERWQESIDALARAISLDGDNELAWNSLALTQKKAGQLKPALNNYDEAAKALIRRLAKTLRNDRANPIIGFRQTEGHLWVGYASWGALYLAAIADISYVAHPSGEAAEEEVRTRKHEGLYWVDVRDEAGRTVRRFMPNYFNTMQTLLRKEPSYSHIIGNRGTALEVLGRYDEAQAHILEAEEFSS